MSVSLTNDIMIHWNVVIVFQYNVDN